jgi:hydrogenase-4 membrane subunit HyfE
MEKKHFSVKDIPSGFNHKTSSSNTFWIIFVSVLFFLFLVFSKWNKIEEFFGFSLEETEVTS